MTISRKEWINKYWHYYLMLEEKFIETTRFVELDERNFRTFSNEYALLLEAIGAELDCFFKLFCGIDENTKDVDIRNYASIIKEKYSYILDYGVDVIGYDINEVKPFAIWEGKKAENWWQSYNNIKHNRYNCIEDANLKNVLYAISGLFVLEQSYLHRIADEDDDMDILDRESALFKLVGYKNKCISLSNISAKIVDEW